MLDDQGVTVRTSSTEERPQPPVPPAAPRAPRRALVVVTALVVLIAAVAAVLAVRAASKPAVGTALPTPTSTAAEADRLTWAPPPLKDPLTVTVTATSAKVELSPDRDYIVKLPASPLVVAGGVRIEGGHNVVIIGGEIAVPPRSEAPDSRDRTGLLLKNQTGTIHVEGVRISGADLAEGINLDQGTGGTVVLQNIAVDEVHGSRDGHHADILQTWAGPSTLRVDGLTGTTEYQGLFLLPQQFLDTPPDAFDLRRIVITGDPGGQNGGAAYLLWADDTAPYLTAQDIVLVDQRTDLEGMLRPFGVWEGGVRLATTADGAKLPEGTPGVGYSSPGYQKGAS
jgi:hypothetical protein